MGSTLTVSAHALGQALLQTAVLAAVAAGPVDLTVALSGAGVGHGGQLAPPEKSLRIDLTAVRFESCRSRNNGTREASPLQIFAKELNTV